MLCSLLNETFLKHAAVLFPFCHPCNYNIDKSPVSTLTVSQCLWQSPHWGPFQRCWENHPIDEEFLAMAWGMLVTDFLDRTLKRHELRTTKVGPPRVFQTCVLPALVLNSVNAPWHLILHVFLFSHGDGCRGGSWDTMGKRMNSK